MEHRARTKRWPALSLALALILGACADDDGRGTQGSPCDRPDTPAVDHRVILSGRYFCSPPGTPTDVVATDAEAWSALRDALAGCMAVTADDVDFTTEYVQVLGAYAFMSCGFDYHGVVVRASDGGPYVELEVTDQSGGCAVACASGMAYVVAVALPRSAGETPTSCVWVHPGCA